MAFSTDTPIDRLTLKVSSLLGVDIGQELEVYEVLRAPAMPVINGGEANHYICQNETATLNATVEGNAGPKSDGTMLWKVATLSQQLIQLLIS